MIQEIHVFDIKGQRITILPKQIAKLEARRNYTVIHLKDSNSYVSAKNLQIFEESLGRQFVRVNRGEIVSISWIRKVESHDGNLEIWLRSGECAVASRRRKKPVERLLSFHYLSPRAMSA